MRQPLLFATIAVALVASVAYAQEIAKPAVPGVTNFAKFEATIACGGATTTDGIAELKNAIDYAASKKN